MGEFVTVREHPEVSLFCSFLGPPGGTPLLVVHGGPDWLYPRTWWPDVQSLVDEGFAVAMVNYRGSIGFGRRWRDHILGNIGFPEVEDVVAGLDDLVARGIADPERVVIGGWSWGGYITLLALGTHPDRFAAGVAATLAATMARQQRTAALLGALAIGAKGWPVVLAIADWLEGRKVRAALSALVSIALAGLLLTLPGLRAARAFSGIHTDTLGGAALTLARTIAGEPVGRFDAAGAIYVDAPAWAYLLGLNVGLVVAALALMRVDVPPSPHAAFALTGALILALLLASPLFSPQFVLWVTPFLALNANRRVRVAGFAVVTLTAVFMFGWNPLYEGNLWWVWVVNLRNVALMMLAVMAAWTVGGVELAVSSEEKRLEHDERPRTVAAVR